MEIDEYQLKFAFLEYHPWCRSFSFRLTCGQSNTICDASILCHGQPSLTNAWVDIEQQATSHTLLTGAAILLESQQPESLSLKIEFTDSNSLTIPFPEDIPVVTAGVVSVERTSEHLLFLYWTTTDCIPWLGDQEPLDNHEIQTLWFGGKLRKAKFNNVHEASELKFKGTDTVAVNLEIPGSSENHLPPSSLTLKSMASSVADDDVAWIIGNGPSVNVSDLEKLESATTFCFNRFYLSYDKMSFRPSFLLSGDSQMIEDFSEEMIGHTNGITVLASEKALVQRKPHIWLRQKPVFPSVFSQAPHIYVTPGGASAYVALQLAFLMGFRRIFLYGFDFGFQLKRAPGATDVSRSARGEGNHFIKNYRSGKAWAPPSFRNIANSYFLARIMYESHGGFIRNVTHGGELEIFPRQPFSEALLTPKALG